MKELPNMNSLKKILLSLIIVAPSIAICQVAKITPILGYNYSNVYYTHPDFENSSYKTNYFIGIGYKVSINDLLSYSTNFQYSKKGFKSAENNISDEYNYLDILHQIHFSPIQNLSVNGGLNTGILINSNQNVLIKTFDVGLVIGMGYDFSKITLFTNLNYGLKNLNTSKPQFADDSYIYRNFNLQMGIGYSLDYFGNFTQKEKHKRQKHSKNHELGLKYSGLNIPFNILYKKEMSKNKFSRISLFTGRLEYVLQETNENSFSTQIGLGLGIENRKILSDYFEFINGFETQISFSFYKTSKSPFLIPSLKYIFGIQYLATKNLSFGFELTPSLSMPLGQNVGYNRPFSLKLNFSPIVELFAIYRFKK